MVLIKARGQILGIEGPLTEIHVRQRTLLIDLQQQMHMMLLRQIMMFHKMTLVWFIMMEMEREESPYKTL